MSDFDEKIIERLKRLEREVERLQVKERPVVITDHGNLTGLGDNDHPQYLLSASTNYPRADGWIPVSGTWTYASATTINVPSGATNIYSVGMGIRLTQSSTVKYFYIIGVTDTVLTITGGSDYTLADATISAVSYTNTPGTAIGFPQWFNWTAEVGGTWAAGYTVNIARFNLIGKTCFFTVDISGTSNSTNTQIIMPLRSYNTTGAIWAGTNAYMQDNGTALTAAGRWYLAPGSTVIYAYTNMASGAWTASGAKRLRIMGFYEIA